jgi:hypothetical protein
MNKRTYCCDMMESQIEYSCEQHGRICPDRVLLYSRNIGYLLVARNAEYSIQYCPWCGEKVPKGFSPEEPGRYMWDPIDDPSFTQGKK